MKQCEQTKGQSVYQHGLSVCSYLSDLILFLRGGQLKYEWRLPHWLLENKELILAHLLPWSILEEYTLLHDLGKPFCLQIDEEGKRHFPNHAQISYETYLRLSNNQQVANLIKMDMDIHVLKSENVQEFATRPEAVSLLLAGLSEIHSNSQMWGGIESTGFKIKFKHLDKRGKAILHLIKEKYECNDKRA